MGWLWLRQPSQAFALLLLDYSLTRAEFDPWFAAVSKLDAPLLKCKANCLDRCLSGFVMTLDKVGHCHDGYLGRRSQVRLRHSQQL